VVHGEGGESESERTDDHLLNPDRDLATRQGEIEASVDDLRLQLDSTWLWLRRTGQMQMRPKEPF
jgi:hypothetical protein